MALSCAGMGFFGLDVCVLIDRPPQLLTLRRPSGQEEGQRVRGALRLPAPHRPCLSPLRGALGEGPHCPEQKSCLYLTAHLSGFGSLACCYWALLAAGAGHLCLRVNQGIAASGPSLPAVWLLPLGPTVQITAFQKQPSSTGVCFRPGAPFLPRLPSRLSRPALLMLKLRLELRTWGAPLGEGLGLPRQL